MSSTRPESPEDIDALLKGILDDLENCLERLDGHGPSITAAQIDGAIHSLRDEICHRRSENAPLQ